LNGVIDQHLIEQLSTIASGLASVHDLASFAEEVERALGVLVDSEYNGLYLWDFEAQRLRLFVARGFNEQERREAERTAWDRHPGSIFRQPRMIHIPDVELDGGRQTQSSARAFAVRSRLFMPVMYQRQPLGVFGFGSSRVNNFASRDIEMLKFMCRLTGVVYRQLLDRMARQRVESELAGALEQLKVANVDLQHARDQALDATRAKSAFLATMSHELRTPLNAIIGYTELIIEEYAAGADPGLTRDLVRIDASARHLLGLISDVLDLSKIEAGKFTLHAEDVDLASLIASVDAACRPGQQRSDNRFVLDAPERLPALRADATALRRILINLLGNAHKFTQRGVVTLRIGEQEVGGARRVVFTVEDSGIGMSEAQVRRIFDAFTQADASISRRFGGTGLGLAITQQLVHLMGGDIGVTSAPGAGSTFSLWLPIAPPG
jgi:signal transduction histidine kinase